jgi:hypothetical protein
MSHVVAPSASATTNNQRLERLAALFAEIEKEFELLLQENADRTSTFRAHLIIP